MKTPARKSPAPAPLGSAEPARTAIPTGTTPNSCGTARIDPKWSWHHRTLLRLRDRLLRSQTDHVAEASSLTEMSGGDVADTAQEESDRDILWAELGAEGDRLFEIDCALQRMRDGSYGRCEETGADIPLERLRALPWTRYCRAAAQKIEERLSRRVRRAHL